MSSVQVTQLNADFPLTMSALVTLFLPRLHESVTDTNGHNQAGHVLFYLRRAHEHALALHGDERATLAQADRLFAAEVGYLARRRFAPSNLVAALGTCWYNLVHERGERWRNPTAVPTTAATPRFPRQCDTPRSMAQVLEQMGVRNV